MCLELFLNSPEKRKVLLPSFPFLVLFLTTWKLNHTVLKLGSVLRVISRHSACRADHAHQGDCSHRTRRQRCQWKDVQVKITSSL